MTHTPIPYPPKVPVLGNLPDMDAAKGVMRFLELAEVHGPIFGMDLPGGDLVVLSSQQLVDEVCDETRFEKTLAPPLLRVREFAGDGLFTSWTDEPNWAGAHRILMPAFGPAALRDMFEPMVDIADQLLLKWERLGPDQRIDISDDTTRLTLDTIALCSFDYRFNSLYSETQHPFVGAMTRSLVESGHRAQRLPVQNRLALRAGHQYAEDRRLMYEIVDQLIDDRRRHPHTGDQTDILDTMLTATDPQTGQPLPDENVRYQLLTFLIAGHETTSGLLTFTLYQLLRHPQILQRAQAFVDEVLGDRAPTAADLARLGYLDQVLKESLRLWPTAPAFSVRSKEDETTIGDGYRVRRDQNLLVLLPGLHRDPEVWGPDAADFDPDRFAFDRAEQLPPNAWKPFGNGQRSCIGRGFALQEATLFMAMLLQRFDLTPVDPDYQLELSQTLTIKPAGLQMRARRRPVTIRTADREPDRGTEPTTATPAAVANHIPVRVLYGSNAGSAQAFAQRIANDAAARGYTASLDTLDSAVADLSTEGLVVAVTASYEGLPPDNAGSFLRWVQELAPGTLDGARFTVFGCGNKDWARTYQAVPKAVDAALAAAGASRLVEQGEANARGDFFGDFEDWYADFWPRVATEFGQAEAAVDSELPTLQVEFVGATRDPIIRHHELELGTVVANRELVDVDRPGARSKRHLEIALPAGMSYRTGDYLAVLPLNPAATVDRVLNHFGLAYDAQLVIRPDAGASTFLPTDRPVAAGELLASYVELGQPATRRQVGQLASSSPCPPERAELQRLAADPDAHASEIIQHRVSVIDLLERYPSIELTFASYLQLLGPLTPRQYSISSSPRWSPDHVTVTVAVLAAPALSGSGQYLGAASNYLASARPGSAVAVSVRPSNVAFQPPESLQTPLILACAGSGLAPFRGFLQDRALAAEESGERPAPTLLFFGCDARDVDFLYAEELTSWAEQGVVDVRPTFSETPEDGLRYVQDRIWADRADVRELIQQGGTFFVCGDGRRMAPAVFDTCARIYAEATGATATAAEAWLSEMQQQHGRYVADVFA